MGYYLLLLFYLLLAIDMPKKTAVFLPVLYNIVAKRDLLCNNVLL